MDQENNMDETLNTTPSEKSSFFDKERNLRLLKFVIVSTVGLGLNYLIFFLVMQIFKASSSTDVLFSVWFGNDVMEFYKTSGFTDVLFTVWFLNVSDVIVSQAVAIVIIMVYNYIINKIWTFKKQEKEVEFNTFWQFIKFAVVGASGTVINLGLVYLFYDTLSWNEYLAITIGFVVSVLTNFILNDIWTFNPKFGKEREK